MKKISIIFVTFILLLTGCNQADIPEIEDYTWEMSSVQSKEQNGQAVAYGERGSSTLDTAKYIDLICAAKDGSLTLTDTSNGKKYLGTYKLKESDPQATHYDVLLEGNEGFAVVSMTTYHDGSQVPTFIISLDDYTINFFAE